MKALLIASLMICSTFASANELFIVKKNKNPKNTLHYRANIESCTFKSSPISQQWIMGEEDGHVEGLTGMEKSVYQPKITYQKDTEVDFTLGAMDKMGSKLPNKKIRVRIENCKAKAYLEIKGQEIQLKEIFANVGVVSVSSITITGVSPGGSVVTHKIEN